MTANSPLRAMNSRVPSSGSTKSTRGAERKPRNVSGSLSSATMGTPGNRSARACADHGIRLAVGGRNRLPVPLELDVEGTVIHLAGSPRPPTGRPRAAPRGGPACRPSPSTDERVEHGVDRKAQSQAGNEQIRSADLEGHRQKLVHGHEDHRPGRHRHEDRVQAGLDVRQAEAQDSSRPAPTAPPRSRPASGSAADPPPRVRPWRIPRGCCGGRRPRTPGSRATAPRGTRWPWRCLPGNRAAPVRSATR